MTNKKPPIVPISDPEPLQNYFDDGDGNRWNVARLIDDAKDLKIFDAPLSAIDLSYQVWQGADMVELALHCKKVNDADLSKPIIFAWNGMIADGRHRVIKAIVQGEHTIKAVRMTWRPTPCREATE